MTEVFWSFHLLWWRLPSDIGLGTASIIIQSVGSNANLDRVGRLHGLEDYICRNPSQTLISPVTMSATVEAILGAVYLDGDIYCVSQVMQTLGLVAT